MQRAGGKASLGAKASAKAETATMPKRQKARVAGCAEGVGGWDERSLRRPHQEGVYSGCNEEPVQGFKQE